MATFVLVHGAWHGGWCWKRVATLLRQAGHDVFTPTLTGLGERAHLMCHTIDLSTHIQDILGVLRWEDLTNVILCGHSYGGMVISGVADRVPERLRALLYLDAFVPEDGACMMDYAIPERAAYYRESARTQGDGFRVPPPPAEVFKVNPRDQAWVDRQCVAHPLRCFEERLHLTGAWKAVPKHVYVYAVGYAPSAFTRFYETLQRQSAWRTMSVPCGHDVMVDMPQALAEILVGVL